jgi:hypothetical protein
VALVLLLGSIKMPRLHLRCGPIGCSSVLGMTAIAVLVGKFVSKNRRS